MVEILSVNYFGKGSITESAGTFDVKDGKIVTKANKGFTLMMKRLLEDGPTHFNGKEYDPEKDPEGWLKNLPNMLSGSKVRAVTKKGGSNGNSKAD